MDAVLAAWEFTERKERVFRERINPLDYYSEQGVRDRYRLWPHTINAISELLDPVIGPKTSRSNSLSTTMKVCNGLRFLAVGSYKKVVADLLPQIDPATAHRHIDQFLDALTSEEIVSSLISFKRGMDQRRQECFDVYGWYIVVSRFWYFSNKID